MFQQATPQPQPSQPANGAGGPTATTQARPIQTAPTAGAPNPQLAAALQQNQQQVAVANQSAQQVAPQAVPRPQAPPTTQNPSAGQPQRPPTSADVKERPVVGPRAAKKRIGDILLEEGTIDEKQLRRALSDSMATKTPLGTMLVKLGYISDATLGKALAKLHNLEYVNLDTLRPEQLLKGVLSDAWIGQHKVIPMALDERSRRLTVIVARPDDYTLLDEIATRTGYRPVLKISTHREISQFIDKYFVHHISTDEALKAVEDDIEHDADVYGGNSGADDLEAEMAAEDAPIVRLVNSVLMEAIEAGASDIHIEPQQERLLIRFRIDGILREVRNIPKKAAGAIISRVKVASSMDIAERRRPQDGRMKIKRGTQEVDMRVNTLPIQFGEKICIRILKANATTGGLKNMAITPEEASWINTMIREPNGIVLVTGPTGSGKTTTLYGCLREINNPDINISTCEDPIEYPLSGINQVPINNKAGLTFASALRALLRQDPDVILVGEIRDEETLEASIHAALTGHLVFSTLHTNSAAKTVTRLLEMGAPSYMVSSTVVGILAQRLMRKICPHCKTAYEATPEDRQLLKLPSDETVTLYKGAGCAACDQSGYQGRVGIYEVMRMTRELKELIDQGASTFAIEDMAIRNGMFTLAMDAKRKALNGLVSTEEVVRVLGLDLQV